MLPPHRFYYLHNFQRALDWIGERYADLLDVREQGFLTGFSALPQQSQALLVRMLMRRGPWFRADKLVYEEIPDIAAAAGPLLAQGWIDADAAMALDELFALHTKPELLQILDGFGLQRSLGKREMLQFLQQNEPEAKPYAAWFPAAPHAAWRVTISDLAERLRLMFFGNLHQDWSEFVLADQGIFLYESVAFDAQSRAFQSRADVDGYLALQQLRQLLVDSGDAVAVLAAIDDGRSEDCWCNPWLERRRAKLLLRVGQACERAQDWALASEAYAQCNYPGARHRRIRVLERQALFGDALALARSAQAEPESDEESQRIVRMLPRLLRSLGEARPSRRAHLQPEVAQMRIDVELEAPRPHTAVEYALRDHWQSDAAPIFYVENALINSLFGLLCWPAIFAPLPGAFFHPFQTGPADLSAPDFAARRAALFDECLALLDGDGWREVILQRFDAKAGTQSPFVFWGTLTPELLALALACIPAAHLKLLFARLLRDVKANRSGFPDLVRFWPAEQRYELVEVKGPGDKLQDNQIRWLEYCAAHGIPVRVCHVRWRDGALPHLGAAVEGARVETGSAETPGEDIPGVVMPDGGTA